MSDSEMTETDFLSTSSSEKSNNEEIKIKKRGRPRKYLTEQERINAISKKQCAEKREKTKLKQKLIKEGHQNQFQLIELLQTRPYEIDYINEILKNLNKYEINKN